MLRQITTGLEVSRILSRLSAQTFASLRHKDYRYLWFGTMFMSAGLWIQNVTLGWFLYDMTNSAVLLGILNGLKALPYLLFGLVAGVVADRMDRRKLLLVIQPILMVTAFFMGYLIVSKLVQVWHIFVFAVIAGTGWAFAQPIRQALVPNVVPKEIVMNAVALNSVGFNIVKIIGPALGGVLIAWIGAGGNFFVQAVTYTGVFYMIYLMSVPSTPPDALETSALANLKDGLNYVLANPAVLAVMITSQVPWLFAMPYLSLMPVFQKDVLGVDASGLGFLMAAPGVGAVLSLLLLASFADKYVYKGRLLLLGLVVWGLSLILFSRAVSMPMALLMLIGVGACQLFFNATSNTMLQIIVPDTLRGRIMSIYMLNRGITPFGSMVAGLSTAYFGAPNTVTVMGLSVIVLAGMVAWKIPQIRNIKT